MTVREHVKSHADTLPEDILEKVLEFISFQKYSHNLFDNDDDYFDSVPGMAEIIQEGLATPLSECISLSDVRKGVRH